MLGPRALFIFISLYNRQCVGGNSFLSSICLRLNQVLPDAVKHVSGLGKTGGESVCFVSTEESEAKKGLITSCVHVKYSRFKMPA